MAGPKSGDSDVYWIQRSSYKHCPSEGEEWYKEFCLVLEVYNKYMDGSE